MQWELIDKNGKTHDCFDTRDEAINALREEEDVQPDFTVGWMLQRYDDAGDEIGEPEWADELLAASAPIETMLSFVVVAEGAGLFAAVPAGGSSGKATPIRRGFRRPPRDAKGTRALSEAETLGEQSAAQSSGAS
jgi:hypothetical protein